MNRRRPHVRAVMLSALVILTLTATSNAEPLQFWLPTNTAVRVHGPWSVNLGVEPRWEDGGHEPYRVLFRPALVFEPRSNFTLWFGYGDTEVRPTSQRDDQQLWQQVLYSFRIGGWTVSPRVRVEERFVERTDGASVRVRGQLRVMHPIPLLTRWNAFASHESFVPVNDVQGSQSAGYGESRFLVGVQRRVLSHVTLEPGFLWKFNNRRPPLKDTWNRAISLGVTVRY